jgi:CBS domain-containing protein
MQAEEIMSKRIVTISKDKTAYDAASLMRKHDIGALPVIEKGKCIGILTESDIFKDVVAKNILPKKVLVKNIMSKKAITLPPDAKIFEINKVLAKHNIRRVLIAEDNKLIGIVSASDLIRQAYHWER